MRWIRHGFLTYTLFFIGWYALATLIDFGVAIALLVDNIAINAQALAMGRFIGSTILLGTLVASEGKFNPDLLPWLLMLNPTDIYRLLNIVAFGDSNQLSGVLSLGSAGLWLGLVLWCAIPLAGALLLFRNRRI